LVKFVAYIVVFRRWRLNRLLLMKADFSSALTIDCRLRESSPTASPFMSRHHEKFSETAELHADVGRSRLQNRNDFEFIPLNKFAAVQPIHPNCAFCLFGSSCMIYNTIYNAKSLTFPYWACSSVWEPRHNSIGRLALQLSNHSSSLPILDSPRCWQRQYQDGMDVSAPQTILQWSRNTLVTNEIQVNPVWQRRLEFLTSGFKICTIKCLDPANMWLPVGISFIGVLDPEIRLG
jgi:hypothetical protein